MRFLVITLMLVVAGASAGRDRNELMEADWTLARATELVGMSQAFLPALTDDAVYLHPGAPLLRGRGKIRDYLATAAPLAGLTWVPAYADVSADGTVGYTYGWTRFGDNQGKYLTCWRKSRDGEWRIFAYVRTTPVPMADPGVTPEPLDLQPAAPVRGTADQQELLSADSVFSAMSVRSGTKAAFLAFSAGDAMTFGSGTEFNSGREAIGAGFNSLPAGAVLEWRPVFAEVAPSGDLGCTAGEATIMARHSFTKYLTVWKRQADGSWKFVADGGNVRPAPDTASGTPPPEG
jgi:ketosteroid isomerase-like protein